MRHARLPLLVLLSVLLAPITHAATPPTGPAGLPYVGSITTVPEHPQDGDEVSIRLEGGFPYPCGETFDPESTITSFAVGLRPRTGCRDPIGWVKEFPMGRLRAGNFTVMLELHVVADPAQPHTRESVYFGRFEFAVGRDSLPTPGLPFVDQIHVHAHHDLPVEIICPSDSIQVDFRGTFPADCYSLRRIEVIPVPYGAVRPGPPLLRLVVDDGSCLGIPCATVPTPWTGTVTIAPLPPGPYGLPVELMVVSCPATNSDIPVPPPTVRVPFHVDTCGPPPPIGCLAGVWEHPRGIEQCDAFIGPAQPAQVTLTLATPVALSGLQGSLRVTPGFEITRLETVGPAAGMHLSWVGTGDGARFVMFAREGAPIPPAPSIEHPDLDPVLRVTVTQTGRNAVQNVIVAAGELLGADQAGGGVVECVAFRAEYARICTQRDCDHNGDGRVDVRDLVLMVRCLNGGCPAELSFDCNQDAGFDIDDVICCARRILGRGPCPDCPPDTTAPRPAPEVRLGLGVPVADVGGLALPVRIEHGTRLGAARFELRFPSDRFEVAGIDADPAWLALHETRDGRVVIGLIKISEIAIDAPVDVRLRLRLRNGSEAGGEVSCESGEFSGDDGAPLAITIERGAMSLGGPARIELSENRPNPFSEATRFSLTLSQPAAVEVGVYDVAGRLVAALHRGPLEAGVREFVWNGRLAGGEAARSGIYFIRAASGVEVISRRMVLLAR